jgi:hypothetical protein
MSAMEKRDAWLEAEALALGTDEQRERWNAGALPDPEIATLARNQLFQPLDGMVRWRKIGPEEIRHLTHLGLGCSSSSVEFDSKPTNEIDAQQWVIRNRIMRACAIIDTHEWMKRARAHCEIEVIDHIANCVLCDVTVSRLSVIVRVPWVGRMLMREYAL